MGLKRVKAGNMKRGGFTLLEILVATAILSLVASMIFASFTSVMSASAYVKSQAQLSHTTRFIIRVLTEDLASASTLPNNLEGLFTGKNSGSGDQQSDELFFTGFGRRFVLTGSGSDQALISWFTLKDKDGEKLYLMRGENPNIFDVDMDKEKSSALEVTDQLVSFGLRYLEGTEWKDSFDSKSKNVTPKAVSVEFTLQDEYGNSSTGRALIQVGGKS